jgi:hypothetical protein
MLDLREPIAWFFGILGLILCAVWAIQAPQAPMADASVNWKAGVAMLLFGAVMKWLARKRA